MTVQFDGLRIRQDMTHEQLAQLSLQERVARGITLLNQDKPTWRITVREHVQGDRLYGDILSHVYGDFQFKMRPWFGTEVLGPGMTGEYNRALAASYGFVFDAILYPGDSWQRLDDAWNTARAEAK